MQHADRTRLEKGGFVGGAKGVGNWGGNETCDKVAHEDSIQGIMNTSFYGQQDGERVLYRVEIHPLVHALKLAKVIFAGLILTSLFWVIGGGVDFSTTIRSVGVVLGIAVALIGWWNITASEKKSAAYITDRRVIRFSATTPWPSIVGQLLGMKWLRLKPKRRISFGDC